jgi:peptidoglycan/xylan/chitin deacetylase (PgdA/CDA1 family)
MSVLVLMYHGVDERPGPLFVSPSLFEAHLDVIVASGLPVLTMSEVGTLLRESRLPPHAVALTFDDGFASVLREAAPRIAARGLRATVFCVAGHLGATNRWSTARADAPVVRLSPAADLPALVAAGFEIGAHGMHHTPLDTENPHEIRSEVLDARVALEKASGHPIVSFAYPYGAPPSRAADAAVREAYTSACTTRIGRVTATADRYTLPRVDACYLRSPRLLGAAIRGGANVYLRVRRFRATVRRRVTLDYSRSALSDNR